MPHAAVPEASKGKVYTNQKNLPIEIVRDMFEHFALRAFLFFRALEGKQHAAVADRKKDLRCLIETGRHMARAMCLPVSIRHLCLFTAHQNTRLEFSIALV